MPAGSKPLSASLFFKKREWLPHVSWRWGRRFRASTLVGMQRNWVQGRSPSSKGSVTVGSVGQARAGGQVAWKHPTL